MDLCVKFDPTSEICARCQTTHELIQFERDMKELKAEGVDTTLICYDIISLRKINHAYGRKIGDALLSAVACYVANRTHGTVYRIEGDLYCVVVQRQDSKQVVRLAREIDKRFDQPWELEVDGKKTALFINAVLSVIESSLYTFEELYPDLFERALEYSRKVKDVTVFDYETERVSREYIQMQMDLKSCILRGMVGFDVSFQPIADPISGTWKSLEALCRWNRPGHGGVSPFTFIKETEEMGYIHNLGAWILDGAIKTCKQLRLDQLDSFFVSVNISALQIVRHDFVETVMGTLQRYDYPSNKLLLEITESTEFVINDDTRAAIDTLRENGVMFALDDFGTGYSSFNSLKNMPVDYLKSDREFILNIEQDSYLQYFLFVMSEVAHSNNMKLIAEGVESKEQLDCVVHNGADLIQGYYFGKPLTRQDLQNSMHKFKQPSGDMLHIPEDYIDFTRWMSSREAYSITPALLLLLNRCMDILSETDSSDASVNTILGIVGGHIKVKRAFVFLNEEGPIFSNRYEWCAEGVKSQMSLLQNVDSSLDGFYEILVKNRIFITSKKSQLPENLNDRLKADGQEDSIQSLVVMPLTRKDEVIGFVGFDDSRSRQWTPEEMILLHNLCLLVLIVLNSK